jgi:RNA polymerase sigma-70 factor (ECF subfamily)
LTEELTRHRESLLRYTRSIVRDTAVAEDLTQEVFARACDKHADLEDPARLEPWLYRIATNLCRDRFRSASFRHRPASLDTVRGVGDAPVPGPEPADEGPRLDKVLEQREMSSCVQAYLAGLPDTYRAAILLHDAEGMTNPEIASMLGISLATVKIRIHRARQKLREALREACSFSTDERGVLVCDPKSTDDDR